MIGRWASLAALLSAAALAAPAHAADTRAGMVETRALPGTGHDALPPRLDAAQRDGYAHVFQNIRKGNWDDVRLELAIMPAGPLHAIARAELYLAKGSPKATREDLLQLLAEAPELPQAEAIARLARARGAAALPELPYTQALSWAGGAPTRRRLASMARGDAIAADLAARMQPFIKADDGMAAQALLESTLGLSLDATTEWQVKVGWIYYIAGDDANARSMAAKAAAGNGDWVRQANWLAGLAAWRQHDCVAAASAFDAVAAGSSDVELRAAGLFWAARADLACGHPERIEARLTSTAQYDETFYGLLARETLGIRAAPPRPVDRPALDWDRLSRVANVRVAAALAEIGEVDLADAVLRRQARIGDPADYPALVRLAGVLDLPATQLWLAHNAPAGAVPVADARYPAPNWTPDGGWRVDKALVLAHTLQESSFRTNAVSAAGAYGLMQIRPAAASDIARQRGVRTDRAALGTPSTNFEIGQSYLERLRDQGATGGLLPKVIAAYNAGPAVIAQWNQTLRDDGDPLLYIESIPYWETRGYVLSVLRNYWIYERAIGRTASPSLAALAQGLWPRFPGLPGPASVRLTTPAPTLATLMPRSPSAN